LADSPSATPRWHHSIGGWSGRRIKVVADLDRLGVCCESKVVADHERVLAWHQTITT
jgi:hypothetical protein